MSSFVNRAVRPTPPRAGQCRAVACNTATTAVEIDSDIFALGGITGAAGKALMRCHAEGADLYINFGSTNAVVANSAAVSGNTVCDRIPQDQEREYEIEPSTDKWFQATTKNGGTATGTLRYRLSSSTQNITTG